MGGIQGVCNFDAQRQHHIEFQRLAGYLVFQCRAVEKLHGDERLAILINLIDGANVRVVQGRSGFGFSLESSQRLWVLGDVLWQKLQGHKSAELQVLSFIDHTHPAAAQLLQHTVMRDGFPDHGSQLVLRHLRGGQSSKSMCNGSGRSTV